MIQIKTVQPYKLYKRLFSGKPSVKMAFFIALALIVILAIFEPFSLLISAVLVAISAPTIFFNPKLKPYYEPGVSYSWAKDYAKGMAPSYIHIILIVIGITAGIILDILLEIFPLMTLIFGGGMYLFSFLMKKYPEKFMDKNYRRRLAFHEDVDYNVKIDLNTLYGVNDKLLLSFQNFSFEQKKLQKGDYLVGVSQRSIYFAHKANVVEKTKVDFDEIDTLGLLATLGNIYIIGITTKNGIDINIIINENDTMVVSAFKLFNTLLEAIDNYILNDGNVSVSTSRRRKVVVTQNQNPSTSNTSANNTEEVLTNRNIEMDGANSETSEKSIDETNREIEITYTSGVLEDIANGEFIESNRIIEL